MLQIDVWAFLLSKLEDMTDAVIQMADKLNEFAVDGDPDEEFGAIRTMTGLLESGAFKLTDGLVRL